MMKTIELEKEKIYDGTLLLVNAQYPLRSNSLKNQRFFKQQICAYAQIRRIWQEWGINMESLVPADVRFPNILIKRDAANILQLILEKISAGNSIVPVSGYRSSEEQTAIYANSFKENGAAFTRKYVALPDHSEHQTGLAIDLGLNKKEIDFICPDFPYEGICNEFRKTAPDYGFIQRYAKNKEEITGISHEPWHFRYVGYPHSRIINDNGFAFEEYIEFIKAYRDDCRFVYREASGAEAELYYIPANDDITRIEIPEKSVYQISGNNIDGFVVTVWRKTHD